MFLSIKTQRPASTSYKNNNNKKPFFNFGKDSKVYSNQIQSWKIKRERFVKQFFFFQKKIQFCAVYLIATSTLRTYISLKDAKDMPHKQQPRAGMAPHIRWNTVSQNLLKPENIGHRYKGPSIKLGMMIITIHATNNVVPKCMMQN